MQESDIFDHLRIIAKDAKGISPQDRAIISGAADELEQVYRLLSQTQESLVEYHRNLMAVNEHIMEMTRREAELVAKMKAQPAPLRMTLSTGWMTCKPSVWP